MSLDFHHVGVACKDLERETMHFSKLGYIQEGREFDDPIQGVRGRFLVGGGPRVELLMQTRPGGVLEPWLKSNVKFYHLAYQTGDFEGAVINAKKQGARFVVQPVPAVAFGNRRIAFFLMPNLLLCELIERRPNE